jgi:hypothetical protein
MKQHSYTSYNIDLQHKLRRFKSLKARYEGNKKADDEELSEEEIQEMHDLNAELCGGGDIFPANQTLFNFFVCIPNVGLLAGA